MSPASRRTGWLPVVVLLIAAVPVIALTWAADHRPSGLSPSPSAAADPAAVLASLSLPSLSPSVGDTLEVPVVISASLPLRDAQFGISFDPHIVRVDGISEGSFFSDWAAGHAASTFVVPAAISDTTGTTRAWAVPRAPALPAAERWPPST
jgi:hypothetical protein